MSLHRLRYLWWAEFQKRGALHYHAILIDPPFQFERDARRWFDAHWTFGPGHDPLAIQTWVQWRPGAWLRSRGGDYVLKDVRKVAGKWYEQDYERMPKGWRTCSNHRLAYTAAAHREHENRAFTVCTAAVDRPWHERRLEVWVERIDWHVPGRHGCVLTGRRRRPGARRQDEIGAVTRPHATGHKESLKTLMTASSGTVPAALRHSGQASPELPAGLRNQPVLSQYPYRPTGCVEQVFPPSLDGTVAVLAHQDGALHGRRLPMTRPRGLF